MEDAASAVTNRMFRELWAMALHDPVVARGIDDFYDSAIGKVVTMVRETCPALDETHAVELTHLVLLISEGTTVVYGTRANRKAPFKRLAHMAGEAIVLALRARLAAGSGPGALPFRARMRKTL